MKSVDDQVRDYYAGQALSSERASEILRLGRVQRHSRRGNKWAALLAAAVLLAAGLWLQGAWSAHQLADRVAAEVAMNHRKDLGVEVATSSYTQLGADLDRLSFRLATPHNEELHDYSLVGGRYCSIQAQLAAQLKVRHNTTGREATLYVTQLTPQLATLPGAQRDNDNVQIEIWSHDGLLYALATDLPVEPPLD